jgi:hypothetical protein
MPNDSPDWANTIATPAIDLGAFTVPANTQVTVYNGPTPAGCHALKVYIQSADPTTNAQLVVILDPAVGFPVQQFVNPNATSCVVALDDVSVPTVRVDVTAALTAPTTGRVVAFLSDQAVAVDNAPSAPVPVSIQNVGSTFPAGAPSYNVLSVAGTACSIAFPANPGNAWHIAGVSANWSAAPIGAISFIIADAGTTVWTGGATGNPNSAAGQAHQFSAGGIIGALGHAMTVTLPSGGGGVLGELSVIAVAVPY